MNRRRRRPNYFGWLIFVLVVLFGYYFNRVYLPATPLLAGPTATPTRSPESYVTEAGDLFKQGKLSQAIDAYKSAINASPQDPTLYVALAQVQMWAGKDTEAQSNAENALLLDNNNALAYAVRAWALDFQEGKNGQALESINEALKRDDRNAVIQAYYVEILMDSGFDNYAKAADQSRVALALDDKIVETHRARAYVLSATQNYEESIREYEEAIKINPYLSTLHIEQGLNYRTMSLEDKAIEEFTKAITLDPSNPEPYYYASRTYATFGDYRKAQQYAESAVKNSPGDATLHANWGVMYYRNFDWSNAVKELGLAVFGGTTQDGVKIDGISLTNDPRISEYYFTLGLALAHTNQCGEALQLVQQLQTGGATDEITKDATNKIITICQENLNSPAVDAPTLSPVEETAVPSYTETPTPTP